MSDESYAHTFDQPTVVTQREVAEALGLSQSTVSLALKNAPRLTPECRARVQKVAREMGYSANSAAVNLSHFKRVSLPKPIRAALAFFNLWDQPGKLIEHKEFARYLTGAREYAEKFGYRLEEFHFTPTKAPQIQRILQTRGIDGVLLSPSNYLTDLSSFDVGSFTLTQIGRSILTPATHVVTSDQIANGILGFHSIRERGYKRVGWVTRRDQKAYRKHVHEAGVLLAQLDIPQNEVVPILTMDLTRPETQCDSLSRWIKCEKPDAIFSDTSTIVNLVRTAGYRVPEDIGVAATSILDTDADSGIDQRSEDVGRAAALTLLSQIHENLRGVPPFARQLTVPGTWVEGTTLPRRI
ncbi:MAG TPA: LacI family DNA-binding transcriptional regulator [Candidatus Methylacidiphilales bacterium]|nr:LacI family DNA-binding transcriptional regulator [Candidatus Methylacidiphilales bacterium]